MAWRKGYMPRRDRAFAVLQEHEDHWITTAALAQLVYGRSDWYAQNALTSVMSWVRRSHPDRVIESRHRDDTKTPGTGGYRLRKEQPHGSGQEQSVRHPDTGHG
jgi:hypothetical protein